MVFLYFIRLWAALEDVDEGISTRDEEDFNRFSSGDSLSSIETGSDSRDESGVTAGLESDKISGLANLSRDWGIK